MFQNYFPHLSHSHPPRQHGTSHRGYSTAGNTRSRQGLWDTQDRPRRRTPTAARSILPDPPRARSHLTAMPKPIPTPYTTAHPPTLAEQEDVHAVYEAIAPHFSSTRYKPWPLVSSFLQSLPPNSIGLDSGAGNGKYVPLASEDGRMCWALDMSWGLLSVAQRSLGGQTGHGGRDEHEVEAGPSMGPSRGPVECLRGELGYDGWRAGVFVSVMLNLTRT